MNKIIQSKFLRNYIRYTSDKYPKLSTIIAAKDSFDWFSDIAMAERDASAALSSSFDP